MDARLHLEAQPNPLRARFVAMQVSAFDANQLQAIAAQPKKPLERYLTDQQGAVMAGLTGYVYWNALLITNLWVHESLRGKGHGSHLLQAAEAEALQQQCTHVLVETASFNRPSFYQKNGYVQAGAVPNWPAGHSFYRYYKLLGAATQPH